MATPETEDKPAPSPLDAERARLRQDGYSDVEISQILIARASGGSQQSTGAGSQGVFSNVLSSLIAVAAHARAVMPSFKKDFETIFDGAAPASSRAGASVSLAIKAVVIAVLGYAAWQEWNRHIISETEIARIQVRKLHAEECSARVKLYAEAAPLHAGDAYALELNRRNAEFVKDCLGEPAEQALQSDRAKERQLDELRRSECKENEKYVWGECRPVEPPN